MSLMIGFREQELRPLGADLRLREHVFHIN
jgi:hypothetical protein